MYVINIQFRLKNGDENGSSGGSSRGAIVYLILMLRSLVSRLESIQSSIANLSEDHKTLLEAIFTHLEEKRGWLADRFDALDEDRLIECSVQLAVVILTAKSDCVINLLGGITSKVGAALTVIKKHKTPVLLNDELVSDIIALIKSDEDIKNEDEIDLNDISDEGDRELTPNDPNVTPTRIYKVFFR